jgi:DNA-binding NarL/FixJ family response regulator
VTLPQVVVIDDHRMWREGVRASLGGVADVVASHNCVEAYLAHPVAADLVLLDLQLDSPRNRTPTGATPMIGTTAVKTMTDHLPVLIQTSVPGDLILAACVAAGALGVVGKDAPVATLGDAIRSVHRGELYLDTALAGLLSVYARRQHAGLLGDQQASALKYRAQGLSLAQIAGMIGVEDPKTVHKYLKTATERLGMHSIDEAARRSGLASGLVNRVDLP